MQENCLPHRTKGKSFQHKMKWAFKKKSKNTPLSMILFHRFDNSRFNGLGGGCNFDFSFKLARVETREDPNTTISGPSSARQRSAIYMAFRWLPMMAQH